MKQRELKFRAWNKHTNSMIKSVAILGLWENFVTGFNRDYIHNSQDWGSQDDFAYDFELMQSIGLKDKDGDEVYEGDILKDTEFDEEGNDISGYYPVVYDPKTCQFCIDNSFKKDGSHLVNIIAYFGIDNIEVVGNIYETPELLPCGSIYGCH